MTVQDMEICLNVSAGSGTGKNTGTDDDSILNLMRSQKTETQKTNVTKSGKIKHDSNKEINTAKKRVKQKLLRTIVAQKLKETNKINQNQASVVHSKLKSQAKSKDIKNKTLKQKALKSVKTGEESTETNKSLSVVGSEVSNDPVISFTKVTKENFGKTLLARKRKSPDKSSNKTLASIFSKQNESEKQVSLLSTFEKVDSVEDPPKKNSKFDEYHMKNVSRMNQGKKRKQKYSEKPTNESNINIANEKGTQALHKSSRKISSLFGHNPEIPHIGQRLVKPINEPVFAGTNFTDLDIHPFMISNLEQNMQITKMTIVQQKAIPQILSGKDVLIRSQTGSGKTLAYALPIVEFLHRIRPKLNRNSGLKALVVVPTRELALQTYECFLKLVKSFTWVVPGYLAGGEKRKAEKARLRKGCNILVSTPGRLLDHVQRTAALKLSDIKYFVLDEADRMFDLGYEKDISSIVSALKVSTPNENTEYDAMKIFQRNVKKIFTDEDVEQMASNIDTKPEAQNHNRVSIESGKNTESESEDINNAEKQAYHSSSDNDSDEGEPYIKSIKTDKQKVRSGTADKKKSNDLSSMTENEHIIENKTGRQTILLSATLTQSVEKLAGLAMNHPVFVDAAKENLKESGGVVTDLNEDLVVPQSVVQSYVVTPPKLRMVTLSAYIAGKCQSHGQHKILVFMATQDMVDYHTEILSSVLTKPVDEDDDDSDPLVDVEFFRLHGNMTQKERTDVFKTFRQANSGVLLCTDVAARGLDMPKVDCVVQYTGPTSARDYVHRIGRTARAGSSGSATIFLIPSEIDFVRMLESRRIRIKQENMDDVLDKLMNPLSKHSSTQIAAIALQNEFENMVLEDSKLREKAHRAYTSWIRFYSSYPRDMREIFNRKNVHLGHFAKSFALRETPQRIGGTGKKLREKDGPRHNNRLHNPAEKPDGEPAKKQQHQRQGDERKTGLLKRVRMLNTSEYDSGLEPMKKPKKS